VADAGAFLDRAGVGDRCEIVAGDFFEQLPAGGDAYVLKSVLHGWEDDQAAQILTACRRAVGHDSRLLVIERLIAPPNLGADDKLSDLNMLAGSGGRERTLDEYEDLLCGGGFRLTGVVDTTSAMHILEAAPA
jgi:hypothetical protein